MFEVKEAWAEFREEMGISLPLDEPFDVYVNGSYLATLLMSPSHVEEAALGFLVGSRTVSSPRDVMRLSREGRKVEVDVKGEPRRPKVFVDDCVGLVEAGVPVRSKLRVSMGTLMEVVKDFEERNRFHGVQATGAYDVSSGRAVIAFDVSRFSSTAKAIGASILSGLDIGSCIFIASGRLSGDLVSMVANAGAPVLVGFKSLLYGGLRSAMLLGITLVLIRGGEPKVLTYPERVLS
ncbi:MAG: formate dehydrogenase accessory sulfurtransferase FdhD [Acidilobaceae archaeon]|nr:formate dehydrogenase accessory sulfurtransferase FdhD [Acidilobaceae archaeon]